MRRRNRLDEIGDVHSPIYEVLVNGALVLKL